MYCFNCRKIGNHKASDCPEDAQYTRCKSCDTVTITESGHKSWCQTKDFRSRYTGDVAFEMVKILRMEFQSIEDKLMVRTAEREITIGESPLWFAPIDAFVSKIQPRSLDFTASHQMKRKITIVNKWNTPLVSLVLNNNVIVVNNRYDLYTDGRVAYSNDTVHRAIERSLCVIKVYNVDEMFKMRLSVADQKFEFDIYPLGPIIVDPLLRQARKSLTPTPDTDSSQQNKSLAIETNENTNDAASVQAGSSKGNENRTIHVAPSGGLIITAKFSTIPQNSGKNSGE